MFLKSHFKARFVLLDFSCLNWMSLTVVLTVRSLVYSAHRVGLFPGPTYFPGKELINILWFIFVSQCFLWLDSTSSRTTSKHCRWNGQHGGWGMVHSLLLWSSQWRQRLKQGPSCPICGPLWSPTTCNRGIYKTGWATYHGLCLWTSTGVMQVARN